MKMFKFDFIYFKKNKKQLLNEEMKIILPRKIQSKYPCWKFTKYMYFK